MTSTEKLSAQYRIAEIAQLSGFTPATLRYYEQAGVLAPPARTAAGYRTYGDRDLERLRLISRAKDLGCTLKEIADLVQAWDDDQCGPVKHRLRSLVADKVRVAQEHIAEQAAFAAQLQATAAALSQRPLDGPCDDTCGCTTDLGTDRRGEGCGSGCGCAEGSDEPAPVLLGRSSDDEAVAPIACSLSGDDMGTRVEEWRSVLARVEHRAPVPDGVRVVFGPGAPLAEIARLAEAEHACCPFFAFAVTVDGRGVALEVTAPPDGQDVLAMVFGIAA